MADDCVTTLRTLVMGGRLGISANEAIRMLLTSPTRADRWLMKVILRSYLAQGWTLKANSMSSLRPLNGGVKLTVRPVKPVERCDDPTTV